MKEVPWNMVMERIEQVGVQVTEGLKTGIEFTYPLAVRQVLVGNGVWLGLGILALIISIPLFIAGLKYYNKEIDGSNFKIKYDTWGDEKAVPIEDYSFIYIPSFIGAGVAFIFGLLFTVHNVIRVLNPQWYAIKILIDTLK